MIYRPRSHHYITLFLEFINWSLFFAVWISLSVNIGQHAECTVNNSSHLHDRECNSIYTVIAFAIIDWLLFSVSFFFVGYAVATGKEDPVAPVNEKAAPIRPSDDNTLRGEQAA
jgi:hypothetical protein